MITDFEMFLKEVDMQLDKLKQSVESIMKEEGSLPCDSDAYFESIKKY